VSSNKAGWKSPILAGNRHLNSSGISQLAMFDYQRATRSFTRGSWTSIFWEPWGANPRELGNSHTCGALSHPAVPETWEPKDWKLPKSLSG
jgi:hypothetical protein